MTRIISEAFDMETEGVRWYVLADDDTVLFVDNLVGVLGRYDHNKYYYVGMGSESHGSNMLHSFGMGFGGAGYALSFPLAKALVSNLDECLKMYPTLYGSDHIVQSCVADLGVSITQEKGFHQVINSLILLFGIYIYVSLLQNYNDELMVNFLCGLEKKKKKMLTFFYTKNI